ATTVKSVAATAGIVATGATGATAAIAAAVAVAAAVEGGAPDGGFVCFPSPPYAGGGEEHRRAQFKSRLLISPAAPDANSPIRLEIWVLKRTSAFCSGSRQTSGWAANGSLATSATNT